MDEIKLELSDVYTDEDRKVWVLFKIEWNESGKIKTVIKKVSGYDIQRAIANEISK